MEPILQKEGVGKRVKKSLGMEFALIPPGIFQMGSPENEKGREDDETCHKESIVSEK